MKKILVVGSKDYPESIERTPWVLAPELFAAHLLKPQSDGNEDAADEVAKGAMEADYLVGHQELIEILPDLRLKGCRSIVCLIPDVNPTTHRRLFNLALAGQFLAPADHIFAGSMACAAPYSHFNAIAHPFYPLGIPGALFRRPKVSKAQIRSNYGLPMDGQILLFSGRLAADRALVELLHVYRKVRDRHDASLVLCLRSYSEAALKLHLEEAGFSSGDRAGLFVFPDVPASEIADLYAAADIFVSLAISKFETFGRSVAEAMACGLPPCVWAYAGHKDMITPECGICVSVPTAIIGQQLDLEMFASKIVGLLKTPAALQSMSENCVERAKPLLSESTLKRFFLEISSGLGNLPQEWNFPPVFRIAALPQEIRPIFQPLDGVPILKILKQRRAYFFECQWKYFPEFISWWYGSYF